MSFSVAIFAVRSDFFESKYFCASSIPTAGLGADSTFFTRSVVKESSSPITELICASFLQPESSKQASNSARVVNRFGIGGLHRGIVKRYHLRLAAQESQGDLSPGSLMSD